MDVAAALIGIIGVAFHGIQRVGFQPGIQPLPHRILRLLQIRPAVDLRCDLRQLLTDFLLCLAIDGLLGLFARLRVNAGGIAGLPAPVGALADGAAALCVLGIAFHMYLSFL